MILAANAYVAQVVMLLNLTAVNSGCHIVF